jgi:drug/metabolite transporter (DMT)-like permease
MAISTGFVGGLVIIRPGFEGFNAYALLALLAVFFAAIRDIATRRIPDHIPSLMVSTATTVAVTIMGGLLVVPMGGWAPVAGTDFVLLLGAAVLLLFGYHFIILSMRLGEISFIAPFRYTALIWAMLAGLIAFAEIPDAAMIVGALIIVGSGLYALYRERVVGGERPVASTTRPGMAPDGT